jgi:hypothetical protein
MKKSLVLFAAAAFLAAHAFAASYWVVLRDGTRYQAKAKPTINGTRATIQMQSGGTLVVDASLIDPAKSEEMTRLGGGQILALERATSGTTAAPTTTSSLGSQIRLRKLPTQPQAAAAAPQQANAIAATPSTGGEAPPEVIEKFIRAFESAGVFEHKINSISKSAIHCELTADSEDKVFNVLSAAAFLVVHNAGVPGTQLDMVEIFMKTTTGGSSGRFQMTQADAQALYAGGIGPDRPKLQDYFIRKVIY